MVTTRKVSAWCVGFLLTLLFSLAVSAAQDDPARMPASSGAPGNAGSSLNPEGWFSLQVEAAVRLTSAEDAVSQYRKKGVDSFFRYEDTGYKGMWYRIYIGRYPTKAKAKSAAAALINQKIIDSFILRKISAEQDAKESHAQSIDHRRDRTISSGDTPSSVDTAAPDQMQAPIRPTDRTKMKPPVVRLSLLDAIRYGLEGNREINVASYEPKQARAQIEGAEAVYDARLFADSTFRRDPNLDSSITEIVTEDEVTTRAGLRKELKTGGTISTYLEVKNNDANNKATEPTYKHIVSPTVEIKQPLLNNIGSKKEQTAIKIANYQANISDAEFRHKVIQIANKVTQVYWKLYLYKELVHINQRNLDLAEEVHRREAERFARGISQQLDVARAKTNAQLRRSTWLASVEEYHLASDRLKLLLNRDPLRIDTDSQVLPVEQPSILPVKVEADETLAKALEKRPEIIIAREQLMIRKVDEELAKHQKLPTLDIIGRYSVSGYGDEPGSAWEDVSRDDDDAWEVGFRFEWAFGNREAKSRYKMKNLGRMQADAQFKRIEDEIKLEVKQVLQRLATLEGEIKANLLAKEAAEKVVEGEFARFDIGGASNEELLRAQDLLAVTSRSLAGTIVEYNVAIQELARVQGTLPEGIVIESVVGR